MIYLNFIKLSYFELFLLALAILLFFLLFNAIIREKVLRYEFLESSDWCAIKIKEIVNVAIDEISDQVKMRHPEYSNEQILMHVPNVISQAVSEWNIQKEGFQSNLERNGISRLGTDDEVFIFSNHYR